MKIFAPVLLFISILIHAGNSTAQDSTTANCRFNMPYIKSGFADAKNVFTAPAHWQWQQYAGVAALAGTIYFLTTKDESITNWFVQHRTTQTKEITPVLAFIGRGGVVLGGTAAVYGIGLLTRQDELSCFALQNAKAVVIASVITTIIKYSAQRARPYVGIGSHFWNGPGTNSDYTSFPSGHATVCFATATTLSHFTNKKIWTAVGFGIAGAIALSRIHDQDHWSSDVLTGASIGTAVALNINRHSKYKTH